LWIAFADVGGMTMFLTRSGEREDLMTPAKRCRVRHAA
jgi:hypothetical protein